MVSHSLVPKVEPTSACSSDNFLYVFIADLVFIADFVFVADFVRPGTS